MKKKIVILICILFCSCNKEPKIPIPNTLEIALGNNYSGYVMNMNNAFEKDSTAMLNLLKIDYIHDGGGYDHGYILFKLMKIYGDKKYSVILKKLSKNDLGQVSQYFEVGLDSNDKEREEMKVNYPICSEILEIK
jgi:hypothetical protein